MSNSAKQAFQYNPEQAQEGNFSLKVIFNDYERLSQVTLSCSHIQ